MTIAELGVSGRVRYQLSGSCKAIFVIGVRGLLLFGDVLVQEGRNGQFCGHGMRFALVAVGEGVVVIMRVAVGRVVLNVLVVVNQFVVEIVAVALVMLCSFHHAWVLRNITPS